MKGTLNNQFSSSSSTTNTSSEHTSSRRERQDNEKDDVLTAEMVANSSSQLGCSHIRLQQNVLPPSEMSVLSTKYLQKLELQHNKIKDLSCLSYMPYLVVLDASHNEIHNFFEFQPLRYLQEVNLSHNRMVKMKDLSAYVSLRKLDLDYNNFYEISGLEQCYRLTHLSLGHNKITAISGLGSLPLIHLCLKGNQIKRIEGLENIKTLQVLDLSMNHITSLSGLQKLHLLSSINLEKNQICEIQGCLHICDLPFLGDLNLQENPVQQDPEYRLAVIFLLQQLTVLDQVKVSAEEKVSSLNKFDPPLDVMAARDHMTNLVYQLMQPQVLYESASFSADSPFFMLVLTGPEGCGKQELVHRLCQEFKEYFGCGICHTTRKPYFGEENGTDYYFVSEEDFQSLIHMGKFIQTMQLGGYWFGLSRDTIEVVAKEGLACCVHLELESVFSLKKHCFESRCILLIPTQAEKYMNHLKSQELYTPAQAAAVASRVALYANTNTQHPGFFYSVVPCDDLEEAYQTLRQIVKDYLSLEENEEEQNNSRPPESTFTGQNETEKTTSSGSRSGTPSSLSSLSSNPPGSIYRAEPQKTPAELASIRRREWLIREAIVGRSPGVLSRLFKREITGSSYESRANSALCVSSLAGAVERPLDVSVLVHSLDTLKGTDELSAVGSSSSDSRPGSSSKSILPQIPCGRKIPVTSSSTQ